MAHSGRARNFLECIEELPEPPIRGVYAIACNVFPDVIEVKLGVNAEYVLGHTRCFRRSSVNSAFVAGAT